MLTLAQIFDCAPSQHLISPPATGRSCISTKEGILLNYFRHLSSVECPGIEDSQVSGVGDILLKLYIMNIKNLSKDLKLKWTRLVSYCGICSEALKMGEILIGV